MKKKRGEKSTKLQRKHCCSEAIVDVVGHGFSWVVKYLSLNTGNVPVNVVEIERWVESRKFGINGGAESKQNITELWNIYWKQIMSLKARGGGVSIPIWVIQYWNGSAASIESLSPLSFSAPRNWRKSVLAMRGVALMEPGTLNNHFKMDVWWNNHFLCKDWQSSKWNNHCISGCLGFQEWTSFNLDLRQHQNSVHVCVHWNVSGMDMNGWNDETREIKACP